jgi:hypothetical protein
MAMEPINIFSHRIDPRGVLAILRSLSPDVGVSGPGDDWQTATLTVARSGEQARLTFRHDSFGRSEVLARACWFGRELRLQRERVN